MTEGVLKRWQDPRGFGFIAPHDGSAEVFFHASALADLEDRRMLEDGVHLSFDVRDGDRGPIASNVRVAA